MWIRGRSCRHHRIRPGTCTSSGCSPPDCCVDDDVVSVMAGQGIEWAAAGDQPQRRVRCGAEDRMPRERRLGDDLDPGDTEDRGRAVCPEHPYLVSQLYVL